MAETKEETEGDQKIGRRRLRGLRCGAKGYAGIACLVVLSPVLLVLLLAWTLVHLLTSITPAVFATSSWVIAAGLYIGVAMEMDKLVMWELVPLGFALLASIALTALYRSDTSSGAAVGMACLTPVAAIVLAAMYKGTAGLTPTAQQFRLAMEVWICVFLFILTLSAARLWRPVSPRRLAEAEEKVMITSMASPFVRRKVNGLSGIEILQELAATDQDLLITPRSSGQASPTAPLLASAGSGTSVSTNNSFVDTEHTRLGGHKKTIVLVHGFGAGNPFWALNLDSLAAEYNVFAVDWRGCGNSDRPKFTASNAKASEQWFVDGLEGWRAQHPHEAKYLRRFTLVAHSLGAVIAVGYVTRHSHRVEHLILASPCGLPSAPERRQVPTLFRFVGWLWGKGLTPHMLVRWAGPFGPRLMRTIITRRTSMMPEDSAMNDGSLDKVAMAEYLYQSWAAPRSGEMAMNTLLQPGAFAVDPLTQRLVSDTQVNPLFRELPMSLIYGGNRDWMDWRHGQDLVDKMKAKGKHNIHLLQVKGGGHQLFVNKPTQFNEAMHTALRQGARWIAAKEADKAREE